MLSRQDLDGARIAQLGDQPGLHRWAPIGGRLGAGLITGGSAVIRYLLRPQGPFSRCPRLHQLPNPRWQSRSAARQQHRHQRDNRGQSLYQQDAP